MVLLCTVGLVVSDIAFIARDVIMLKKGVIVDNAPPAELISRIEGRVWRVPAAPSEVLKLQARFTVTNIQKDDRGVSLRILSDEAPTPKAEPAAPSLEDYYLYVFGEASN